MKQSLDHPFPPRPAACALLFAVLLVLHPGCSSNNGKSTTSPGGGSSGPPPGSLSATTGALEGHLYQTTAPGQSFRFARKLGGGAPLAGVRVELIAPATYAGTVRPPSTGTDCAPPLPGLASATTDAAGYFFLGSLPPGPARVQVEVSSGVCRDISTTVLADAVSSSDAPAVTRDSAIALVKAQLTPDAEAPFRMILGPPAPLPAGTEIAPALGGPTLDYEAGLATVTTAPSWFFYVDEHPDFDFERDDASAPSFYLVDAATGVVTHHALTSWPSINGINYYADPDENALSQDLVDATPLSSLPGNLPPFPTGQITGQSLDRGGRSAQEAPSHPPETIALLIAGSESQAIRANIENMVDAIENNKIPGLPGPTAIFVYEARNSTHPKRDVDQLFQSLSTVAGQGDTFILYFTGHGAGGQLVLDAAEDRTGATSYWQRVKNAANDLFGDPREEWLGTEDFDFTNNAACHVYVILEACFTGTVIDDGKQIGYAGLNDANHPGRDYVILTSASSKEFSIGYNTGQVILGVGAVAGGRDTQVGGAFTNHLLAALPNHAGQKTHDALLGAYADAKTAMNSWVWIKSNPQKYDGINPGVCPCLDHLLPANPSVAIGRTVTLHGYDGYGTEIPSDSLDWTSSDSVHTASVRGGVVTGVAAGPAVISATQRHTTIKASTQVTVLPPVPVSVNSFSPWAGLYGSPVRITGTSLGGTSARVYFTDMTGQMTVSAAVGAQSSDTTLYVTVPSGSATGSFQVVNGGSSDVSHLGGLLAAFQVGGGFPATLSYLGFTGADFIVTNCWDIGASEPLGFDLEPNPAPPGSNRPAGFSIGFNTGHGFVVMPGTYDPIAGSYAAADSNFTIAGNISSNGAGSGTLTETFRYSIWSCTGSASYTTGPPGP